MVRTSAPIARAMLACLQILAAPAWADPGLRIPDVDQLAPNPDEVEAPDDNETTEEEFVKSLEPDTFESLRFSAGPDFISRYDSDSGWKIGGGARFQLDLGLERNVNHGSFGVDAAFGAVTDPKKDGGTNIVGTLRVGGGADLNSERNVGLQVALTVVDRPSERTIEFLRPAIGVRLRHGETAGRSAFMLEPISGTYDLSLKSYGAVSGVAFHLDQNVGDVLELGLSGRAGILWVNEASDWGQTSDSYGYTYDESAETLQDGLGFVFSAAGRARFNLGENAYLLFDGTVRRQISEVKVVKSSEYYGETTESVQDAGSFSFSGISSVGVAW